MADKGNVFVAVDVDITSTAKDPMLPCFLIATRKKGEAKLTVQGQLAYTFRRWDNYGSYLGNNSDRGNDFAMTDTVKFALNGELEAEIPKNEDIYVLAERTPNMLREEHKFHHPSITYEGKCKYPNIAYRGDLEDSYAVIDWRKAGP